MPMMLNVRPIARAVSGAFSLALALGFSIATSNSGFGQTYPSKLIKIVAPFPAGGLVDVLARAVGEELQKSLGQTVIIENRPGAGGNTGANAVATADPDGHTLLMSSAGILTINEFLYTRMPFDPAKAFAPITVVAEMPMLLIVHPKVGVSNLKEFLAKLRAEPGKLNFGSAGNGTTGHLGLVMFMRTADVKIAHVPYRGAAPAVQDLIAGQIDGVVDNPPTVISHVKAGNIRALAVAAKSRLGVLPDVPTSEEAGLPGYEASSWFALVAPAATPKPIIERLNSETVKILHKPALQERFGKLGARLVANSTDEFARLILADRERWGSILKPAGIKIQ
jgi:tripartite-type tricarboxylate transporter receptor subunit TctC